MRRWRIAILVSVAIAVSYLDRQALPSPSRRSNGTFPSRTGRSRSSSRPFLIAYAVMYAAGGKLMDVVGTRAGFLAIMPFWSLACASHGLATSVGMLAVSQESGVIATLFSGETAISSGPEGASV